MVIESATRIVALKQETVIVLSTQNVPLFLRSLITNFLKVIPILISYYAQVVVELTRVLSYS